MARHLGVLTFVVVFQLAVAGPCATAEPQSTTALLRTPITLRDEARRDRSFLEFRNRLLKAARTGDVPALLSMMAPTMKVYSEPATRESVLADFGVVQGIPWQALISALEIGALQIDDGFGAPSLTWMIEERGRAVVVARNVRMREAPRADAKVVKTLTMEIVEIDSSHKYDYELFRGRANPAEAAAWVRVFEPGGRAGFVYGRFVWVPFQTFFAFEKVDGAWKLAGLNAED